MGIDSGMVARLRRQLATGDVVLFTGAGFSRGATARDGKPVASVNDLKQELWRLAFPSDPAVDESSSLGDLFDVAVARAGGAVADLLNRRLRVDPSKVSDRYRAWFSLPWYRHYTLNLDDLDEVVASHWSLPRDILSLSGNRDGIPVTGNLLSVHVNGHVSNFPDVTFSAPQYGQRLARVEAWYSTLVADVLNRPVLFVGTVLEEPGLWQYIEYRQQRSRESVELRPPSYLVTPNLPAARAALLKRYNIDWIEAREDEFFEAALADVTTEAELGHAVLARRYHPSRGIVALKPLSEVRDAEPDLDLSLYLLGREPFWKDLTEGYVIERRFETALLADARTGDYDAVILTGTAASGKSTSAMRLALALEAEGSTVTVLAATEGDRNVARVVAAARATKSDVVVIDDLDLFGDRAPRLLAEIASLSPAPLVVAAIRSSRLQALDLRSELSDCQLLERTVPPLHDDDINALIAALDRANRLGRLSGLSMKERRRVFRDQCGRQLLVAMYQATSGESLHDRVFSECEDLAGASRIAYGIAAIATSERQFVLRDELTIGIGAATGGMEYEKLNVVPDLIRRDLLISDGVGLRVRHRWVAETAIEFYQANGLLGPSLKGLVVALAMKADPQAGWSSREQRLLRRILNHDYLQRVCGDIAVAREVYALVEALLSWDYHYWLQRGSLEVETGNLPLAENFLNSAVSGAPPNDYRVSTEYAYLLLKKASATPRAPGAATWAETALKDLEHAMADRGRDDSYPFHVYGSQGLSWSRRAPLLPRDRETLVRKLWEAVKRGYELHPRSGELKLLADDLKKEYLLFAVTPPA